MWVMISSKNEALANQRDSLSPLEYKQQLIDEIQAWDQEIIYLRDRKKMNCEILWEDMPYSLLASCWEPIIWDNEKGRSDI